MPDNGEAPKPTEAPKPQDLANPDHLNPKKGPSEALRSAIGRAQRALSIRIKSVPVNAEAGKGRSMYKDLTTEERTAVDQEFGGIRPGESFIESDKRYDENVAKVRAARNGGESQSAKMGGNADLESHRFRVSEFSSPKINSLRKEFLAFSYENPTVAGITIFGSHTKGMAKEGSDIDGYLFVEAPDSPDENNNRVLPPEGDSIWESLSIDVGDKFRKQVGPKLGLTPDQTRDVKLRLLSKKRIDNELAELINEAKSEKVSEFLRTAPASNNLDKLFHMQLGKGLDQYRAYVLRRLQMEGEVGDRAWHALIASTEMMERDLKLNRDEKLFPQTIKDALGRFHLGYTEPKYQLPEKSAVQ